jgi:hypothetical protein
MYENRTMKSVGKTKTKTNQGISLADTLRKSQEEGITVEKSRDRTDPGVLSSRH